METGNFACFPFESNGKNGVSLRIGAVLLCSTSLSCNELNIQGHGLMLKLKCYAFSALAVNVTVGL